MDYVQAALIAKELSNARHSMSMLFSYLGPLLVSQRDVMAVMFSSWR